MSDFKVMEENRGGAEKGGVDPHRAGSFGEDLDDRQTEGAKIAICRSSGKSKKQTKAFRRCPFRGNEGGSIKKTGGSDFPGG